MRTRFAGVAVSVMIGLTAGCGGDDKGGGDSDGGGTASTSSASAAPSVAPWVAFNPPTRFDAVPALALGIQDHAEDVLLHGTNAFLATRVDVQTFDLTTQGAPQSIRPERPTVGADHEESGLEDIRHPPVLAEVAGRQVVVVPYTVTIPARGTTREAPGLDLVLIDAQTRQQLPTMTVDFADSDVRGTSGLWAVSVAGVRGSTIVMHVGGGPSMAVDLATRTVLWKSTKVLVQALLGETVLAATRENELEVLGLGLANGVTRWSVLKESFDLSISAIGPKLAVVVGSDYSSGDPFTKIIDADGKLSDLKKVAPERKQGEVTCRYDEVSVAVCTYQRPSQPQYLAAYDSASGRELWRLPDEASRRVAPTVTVVRHGVVYGHTETSPVLLDAGTGKDKAEAQITAVAVNDQAAVAKPASPKEPIQVHRAVG
jgi:hypothetical protein